MATGRTLDRWVELYIDGYELQSYAQSVGPLVTQFDPAPVSGLGDSVQGGFNVHPKISPTAFNAFLQSAALDGSALAGDVGNAQVITVVIGIRAAAVNGDPCFCGQWYEDTNIVDMGSIGAEYLSMQFGDWDVSALPNYMKSWGKILHVGGAETGANSSGTGVDNYTEAATAYGGFMVYHRFGGDGTATLKVQHSVDEVDGNYADLGGCTTGVIDMAAAQYGIVETTATTTTVNRYLRWQLTLGTANTVTFGLAFVRAFW